MITRIWRGRTSRDRADGYEDFLRRTAYPDYGGVEGNRGWLLLRQFGPYAGVGAGFTNSDHVTLGAAARVAF